MTWVSISAVYHGCLCLFKFCVNNNPDDFITINSICLYIIDFVNSLCTIDNTSLLYWWQICDSDYFALTVCKILNGFTIERIKYNAHI